MPFLYFDLGNVLVHFDPNLAGRNVGQLLGCDAAKVFAEMYGSGLEVRYERGEIDDQQFAEELCRALGAACDTESVLEAMAAMFLPHTAMEPIIQQLSRLNVPLGILSNTCRAHWQWVQKQNWAVSSGWFQQAVLSYEVGQMKPEAEIYEIAGRIAGVPAADIFFTDDRLENVQAAKAAGWHAVLFVDPPRLVADLVSFGLAIDL